MMNKHFRHILAICALFSLASCNWLDVDPNLGVDEEEIFGSYKKMHKYFDYVLSTAGSSYMENNIFLGSAFVEERSSGAAEDIYSLDATTDIADQGLKTRNLELKQCNLSWSAVGNRNVSDKPVSKAMWNSIRIANKTIAALPGITDCTEAERDEVMGYAYFVRAYAHFVLARRYGGVPYLDKALGADGEWDFVRPDAWETYQRCAEDFYKAYEYLEKTGWMRRDGLPGEEGHLNSPTREYPSGVSALAFRARALVYAASPLNNKNGTADWSKAAEACAFALQKAEEWKFSLVPFDQIETLYLSSGFCEESIWVHPRGSQDNDKSYKALFAYPQSYCSGAAGVCPTQNFVDLYETRWGDPLLTQADRDAAYAITGEGVMGPDGQLHHYYDQNPYATLDPRFEATIVHDGSTNRFVTGVINIYRASNGKWPQTKISNTSMDFGREWGTTEQDGNGYSITGYYLKKYWEGQRGDKGAQHGHIDNLFRMAELYLLYGEAVNEAYGPQGRAGNCQLTAVDAINVVRNRAGMPDVQTRFTVSREAFRPRIQNERMVELSFESAHYYYDIRRWMTAPERMGRTKMYGMYVSEHSVSEEYPNGRSYERKELPETRQCTWKDCMYWFPFAKEQTDKMTLFKNNEIWH